MPAQDIDTNKFDYLISTHKLNDYNEMYNLNSYLNNATNLDLERLNDLNKTLRVQILKLKQEYMLYEYTTYLYKFRVNLLYFILVCICLVLFCITMYSEQRMKLSLTIIISSSILLFALIFSIIAVILSNSRRRTSYNQYYWSDMNKKA